MRDNKRWYRILDSLRTAYCEIPDDPKKPLKLTPFTLDDAVKVAKISAGPGSETGPGSTKKEMASGYFSTLRKWGYIRRHERLAQAGPGRPAYSYVITEQGAMMTLLESPAKKLEKTELQYQKLASAIQAVRDAVGKKAGGEAVKELFRVHDEVLAELAADGKVEEKANDGEESPPESEVEDGPPPQE